MFSMCEKVSGAIIGLEVLKIGTRAPAASGNSGNRAGMKKPPWTGG